MLSSAVTVCLVISSLHVVHAHLLPNPTLETCEPISIPQCMSLPYNQTRFPNAFGHISQELAREDFQKYNALIRANCSKDLLFFLCTKSFPICLDENIPHKPPILPCRSVCEKIKQDCMSVILNSNWSWVQDRDHNCNLLKDSATSMCVSPEAFVDSASGNCAEKCKRRKPMNFKRFKRRNFGLALRVKLKQVTVNSSGNKTLEIKTLRVYKKKSNCSRSSRLKFKRIRRILVNTDCDCVQLVNGKEYLVAANCRPVRTKTVKILWLQEWKKETHCQLENWQGRKIGKRCKAASSKPANRGT